MDLALAVAPEVELPVPEVNDMAREVVEPLAGLE